MEGVFTCSFTRRDCAHDPIFLPAYQRTNRTRENKILRCFPHCCFGHVPRSYCGASLHLQVDFHVSSSATPLGSSTPAPTFRQPHADDDVMVFARFRPSTSPTLAIGELLPSSALLSALQSDANPSGEWIQGRLLASAHQNAWLFELNRTARWYYGWGSSAATTARNTHHVLEVFVLARKVQSSRFSSSFSSSPETLGVVATTSSPPFKLMSFRRSTGATETTATSAAPAHKPFRSERSSLLHSPPPSSTKSASSPSESKFESKIHTRTPMEELTTVIAFAKTLTLAQLPTGLAPLHRQVLEAMRLSSSLGNAATTHAPMATAVEDVAARVAMWLAVDPEIQRTFHHTLARAAHYVVDKPQLQQLHVEWLGWLRSHADDCLAQWSQHTRLWTMTRLVDEISKHPNHPVVVEEELVELSFRGFVAQVSQTCAASHTRQSRPQSPLFARSSDLASLPSLAEIVSRHVTPLAVPVTWWVCELEELVVESLDSTQQTSASTLTLPVLLWFWRQLACIAIQPSTATSVGSRSQPEQIPSVEIRSSVSSFAQHNGGMRLLLDAQPRWAAMLPSGDASRGCRVLGDLHVGDYAASLDEATGDLTVRCFAWQASNALWTAAWCLNVRLGLGTRTGEMLAFATVERGSLDTQSCEFDEGVSAGQRLRGVKAWTPQWSGTWRYRRTQTVD